ncbi:hypothetical protein UlMin_017191 [Ulmus minor]
MANRFSHFAIFLCAFALTLLLVLVHGQEQSDFISIDCGASEDYTDDTTGINYTTDLNYIDTGERKDISPQFNTRSLFQRYRNVRSFPEGTKNCYTLRPSKGKNHTYLIRTDFKYGNYDGGNKLPEFDLYLGVNKWFTVKVKGSDSFISEEIIHVPQSDYLYVCLVNTNSGTPFISALELRLLDSDIYVTQSGSLELFARSNCGSAPDDIVRYRKDVFDRIWFPKNYESWDVLNNSNIIVETNGYKPPSIVMNTAVTPKNINDSLGSYWSTDDEEIQEFYIYFQFAELQKLSKKQTREFTIFINDTMLYGPIVPKYSSVTTIYSTKPERGSYFEIWINKTKKSTLPPILNAYEIYRLKHLLQSETDQDDFDAMMKLKSTYGLKRNWQGDPCAPIAYTWEGLNCSYNDFDPPRITYLNLSSSGLTGEINTHISDLKMLQTLDLSNNNFTGTVPNFLSQIPSLKVLNLNRNNLSGTLPIGLQEKYKNGSISLSVEGNSNLCVTSPCKKENKKKSNKIIIPVVASTGGLVLVLLLAWAIFWGIVKKRKHDELEVKKQQFSYSEILGITNNFKQILGKGGFGTVYLGYINDTQVAVKMLSPSSAQGYKQFYAEAKLLSIVHHRNLTAFVGYCDEGPNMGLVYEYMANKDLSWHLSDKNSDPLTWEERLKIAMDAAQGLEYLHSGCKPPIIHRDVKTTNILLNEKLEAKLSDFGLSRAFEGDGSHVSTRVVGTPGYLDPEYSFSYKLTEKSDIYSFGVVLLEMITGRFAISKNNGKEHIIEWVKIRLSNGDIDSVMDPRILEQDLNKNSVWKAVEVAVACVSPVSSKRPNMNQIVIELKQCLHMEMARNNNSEVNESSEVFEMMSIVTERGPVAR